MKILLTLLSLFLFLFHITYIKTDNPCSFFEDYKRQTCENQMNQSNVFILMANALRSK